VRRTSFADMACSLARTLEVVGEWWTLLILRDLFLGLSRFEDIRANLGVATNVLTARLTTLVEHGLIERRAYQDHPPRYEYVLTDKGRDLFPAITALIRWGDRWEAGDAGPPLLLRTVAPRRGSGQDPQSGIGSGIPTRATDGRVCRNQGIRSVLQRSAGQRASRLWRHRHGVVPRSDGDGFFRARGDAGISPVSGGDDGRPDGRRNRIPSIGSEQASYDSRLKEPAGCVRGTIDPPADRDSDRQAPARSHKLNLQRPEDSGPRRIRPRRDLTADFRRSSPDRGQSNLGADARTDDHRSTRPARDRCARATAHEITQEDIARAELVREAQAATAVRNNSYMRGPTP
jgi:DNA-binding HxlR family transcriptional regulator